jgi:hypothetical protein
VDRHQLFISYSARHDAVEGLRQTGLFETVANGHEPFWPFGVAGDAGKVTQIYVIQQKARSGRVLGNGKRSEQQDAKRPNKSVHVNP